MRLISTFFFIIVALFNINLAHADYLNPEDMNLDQKWMMYDCINGEICFTKDNGDTYSLDGNFLGNGDYEDFMVFNGTIYGTDEELPDTYRIYREIFWGITQSGFNGSTKN